jgi:tetratricopeptide (TPR) repeat protein
VIKGGAVLKVGDQVVDLGQTHHIYTVEKADGEWIWLVAGSIKGWARKADIVTLDQAIAHCTSEIERNPNAASGYYNRGVIRQDMGDYDQAIADYTEALQRDPNYEAALINRGNARLSKHELDRAIADYTDALHHDARSTSAYLNRALAWRLKREFDKAIADYDEAIRLGMRSPRVYNNRGHVWELKNDLERAVADYTEAIRLDPNYSLAYVNRGYAWQSRGEYEKASADAADAIRLDPKSPWGYAMRAWLLAACPDAKFRDGKLALEFATKACELGGSNQPYLCEVRAAAHAEAGDFAQAVTWQTKAIEAGQNEPESNLEGDRARLELYRQQKPYRIETGEPVGTVKPRG